MWEELKLHPSSKTLKRSLLAGAAALTMASQVHAAGFYLEDQSTRASGRAFSGEAADMGAESLWYNPAAIAGITSSELSSSITPIFTSSRVSDSGSTITQGGVTRPVSGEQTTFKPVELGVIPASASALRINDQWSIGLAVTSPFSFATKYDTDSFARYSALTTRLTTIDLQPTLAWRPVRWLGIGAGPNIEYTDALLTNALPQEAAGVPDGRVNLRGNGWDVGYNVGVQLHPTETVTIGGAYRSKINHTLNGDANIMGLQGLPLALANGDSKASASFNTPWAATFSVRWQVTDRLALEGQGVRTGWGEFQQIVLNSPGGLLPNQLQNYHDTTNGAVGFDYAVTKKLTVRGGVQYDPTPTPDNGRDARVPDGDRFLIAGGYSYKATRNIVLDGAISYIDFIPSHINRNASEYGNISPKIEVPVNIQGEVNANAVTMSVGGRIYF